MNQPVRLEIGKYGPRAVFLDAWTSTVREYLEEHKVVEVELNMAKGWRGDSIAFLSELPQLQSFEILDLTFKALEPIHFLHNLRRLKVTTYCTSEIRVSEFPELEECVLEWRRKARSVFDCTTLKYLFINRYNGKDTEPFSNLVNLERLGLLNAPVTNLHGLSALTRLRSLRFGNLRRLESLAGIEHLSELEELNIDTCKGFHSIEELATLPRLRRLFLSNCGDIESLGPLENLDNLEVVWFCESTNIVDGDMSPLLRLKNLSKAGFKNRRHYSHRSEEFRE